MSSFTIACSDETSSNNSQENSSVVTDENGNVREVNCTSGSMVIIDGVDVCAE